MKATVGVCLGEPPVLVGKLQFMADGNRESCSFAYDSEWLASSKAFALDPYLPLQQGHQYAPKGGGSIFFGCFADSEPDGWGRMVIQRDRQKRGLAQASNSLDFLLAVHDESRTGALRFRSDDGPFLTLPESGKRAAPPLVELRDLLRASSAIEKNTESAADLRLLLDRGSPPGGLRPKCTVIDDEGNLSIAKFPSATDQRDIVGGEILALKLAGMSGINAARGRIIMAARKPVAVIQRFDRIGRQRLMYASARSFLGVTDEKAHAYTEFADSLRKAGNNPQVDIEEIWRRIVFNVLITNVDDHLNNHAFLHTGNGQWTLATAFDLNPAPERQREFKTWISADIGPRATIDNAMLVLKPFGIANNRGLEILGKVENAIGGWRKLALSPAVGMKAADANLFADAFEHAERVAARKALATKIAVPGSLAKPRSAIRKR